MKTRYKVLTLVFLISAISYLDRVCISVAGPRMQADLNLSPDQWGWVVGAFVLTYSLFAVPSARLGERFGARKVLSAIVLWWSAFTSLTAMAASYPMLLITRLLFGAGESGAYPIGNGALYRWFPKVERARAVGIMWMAARVGGALTPSSWSRFSSPRLADVVLRLRRRGRRLGGCLVRVVSRSPAEKKGVSQQELKELEAEAPPSQSPALPWTRVLGNANVIYLMLMYGTYCFGGYFYQSWLHTYLVKGRGFTENQMAVWSTLPFILGAAGCLLGGAVSDNLVKRYGLKVGRRSVAAAGLGLAGLLELATAFTGNNTLAALFLGLGFGFMGCMMPASWAACLDIGGKYAASVSGAMNMAGQAGSFLSSIVFGYMVVYFKSYDLPLIPMAAALFVSSALWIKIDPTRPLERAA
jgi:MFS family permease